MRKCTWKRPGPAPTDRLNATTACSRSSTSAPGETEDAAVTERGRGLDLAEELDDLLELVEDPNRPAAMAQ
eukprot:9732388-Lingulodinium_polyedra.AAC.1